MEGLQGPFLFVEHHSTSPEQYSGRLRGATSPHKGPHEGDCKPAKAEEILLPGHLWKI